MASSWSGEDHVRVEAIEAKLAWLESLVTQGVVPSVLPAPTPTEPSTDVSLEALLGTLPPELSEQLRRYLNA